MSTPEGRSSRKRPIDKCDDNGQCDFTPLSKRINNLHLTKPPAQENFGGPPLEDQSLQAHQQHHVANGNMNGFNGHEIIGNGHHQHHHHPPHLPQSDTTWVTNEMLAQYAPSIDHAASPHYYEQNKLLFALYLERQQRNPQNNRPFS